MKIAFCSFLRLLVTGSEGMQMWSSDWSGSQMAGKELLISPEEQVKSKCLPGFWVTSEKLIRVFLKGNNVASLEPSSREWCLSLQRDEPLIAATEFGGDLGCWGRKKKTEKTNPQPTKLHWIMHQIKSPVVRGSRRNLQGFRQNVGF